MVCHLSAHSPLSSKLLTRIRITTLLRKGPCRNTHEGSHQCSWMHYPLCQYPLTSFCKYHVMLLKTLLKSRNIYLYLTLPTYPASQRLFFRYPCWSFSVLLMSSKYLQTDCIAACSAALAGIKGRIAGLLFAKSLLKTCTVFDCLPTEWALSLPPVFSSTSISLWSLTEKRKYVLYYLLK